MPTPKPEVVAAAVANDKVHPFSLCFFLLFR
jgi:hypothetical protein